MLKTKVGEGGQVVDLLPTDITKIRNQRADSSMSTRRKIADQATEIGEHEVEYAKPYTEIQPSRWLRAAEINTNSQLGGPRASRKT